MYLGNVSLERVLVMNLNQAYKRTTFEPHHVIFDEGHTAKAIYVIKSGAVEIRVGTRGDNPQTLATLRKGEVFGELALIEERSRKAAAIAIEKTEVVEVPCEEFIERLNATDPIMKTVIYHLVWRLRQMTDERVKGGDVSWEGWRRKV